MDGVNKLNRRTVYASCERLYRLYQERYRNHQSAERHAARGHVKKKIILCINTLHTTPLSHAVFVSERSTIKRFRISMEAKPSVDPHITHKFRIRRRAAEKHGRGCVGSEPKERLFLESRLYFLPFFFFFFSSIH